MKFSFIVPIWHKKPQILKRCLKSLLSQSYKDLEIIAVFDGLQEDLKQVVNDLLNANPDLQCITIEHGGACKARNEGAKLATGDFIAFWDADCFAEPQMVDTWALYLKADSSLDFVYSGYKWADRPDLPGYDSEWFDPWKLEKYNYISSMFPLRKEKVVLWDETLQGLQDWDYWRRVVKAGAKGEYIPTGGMAYPFSTELPDADSISGPKANVSERIAAVRAKHGDSSKEILVISNLHPSDAVEIAKILDADYFPSVSFGYWRQRDYKLLVLLGFDGKAFEPTNYFMSDPESQKVIYWTGPDIDGLNDAPYKIVTALHAELKKDTIQHYCDDRLTQVKLENLGLSASIVRWPVRFNIFDAPLPAHFKVLAYCDDIFIPFIQSIKVAMPDIDIELVKSDIHYQLVDYTVNIQFTKDKRLMIPTRNMLLAGRYVLSNIQEPFCGYISSEQPIEDFKRETMSKVRALKTKITPNLEAQAYYRKVTNPKVFKMMITGEALSHAA